MMNSIDTRAWFFVLLKNVICQVRHPLFPSSTSPLGAIKTILVPGFPFQVSRFQMWIKFLNDHFFHYTYLLSQTNYSCKYRQRCRNGIKPPISVCDFVRHQRYSQNLYAYWHVCKRNISI